MESVVPPPRLIEAMVIWNAWFGLGSNWGVCSTSGVVLTEMSWEKLFEVQGDATVNCQSARSVVPAGYGPVVPRTEDDERIAGVALYTVTVRLKYTWEPGQKFL